MVSETATKLLNFARKERDYLKSAVYFIIIRFMDIVSTMILFFAYGSAVKELNPIGSFMISTFGHASGLMISLILTIPIMLISSYYLNKASRRRFKTNSEYGTMILWGAIILGFVATVNNFVQFSQGY